MGKKEAEAGVKERQAGGGTGEGGRVKPEKRRKVKESVGSGGKTVVVQERPKRVRRRRKIGFWQMIGAYSFVLGLCALVFFAMQGRFKLVFQYDRGAEFVVGVLDKKDVVPAKDGWYAFSFLASDKPAMASVVMFQRDRYDRLFIKRIACLPGERLGYRGAEFLCEDVPIGVGIVRNELTGEAVRLYRYAGRVPEGKFFSVGTTRMSYDSKYRGFVDGSWIVGKVYPLAWMPQSIASMFSKKVDMN